ncbi:hypothetical protein EES45_35615 [Streptomyces sp. ADI97-07]|nr:hypothetical protein EES45_35615 [Streptomyces sp. ADI97-07]
MTDSTGHNDERSVQEVLDYLVRHLNGPNRSASTPATRFKL